MDGGDCFFELFFGADVEKLLDFPKEWDCISEAARAETGCNVEGACEVWREAAGGGVIFLAEAHWVFVEGNFADVVEGKVFEKLL